MISTAVFTKDDMKKIGIRFHTARVLTGLKRDEFASLHNLSRLSLKNWEGGLALPRHEGLVAVINALKESGVFASIEWLLYGIGNGPNYFSAHNFDHARSKDAFVNEQILLFKKSQRALGFEPVVIAVKDEAMVPNYRKGDFLGGTLVSHELVKSSLANHLTQKRPWLVSVSQGPFFPAHVYCHGEQWLTNSAADPELKEIPSPSFARIKWHFEYDE